MNLKFLFIRRSTLLIVLVIALLMASGTACNTFCNDHPQWGNVFCFEPDYSLDTLVISHFDRGMDPTEFCGEVRVWSSPEGRVQVASRYALQVPSPQNHWKKYSVMLEIGGNELMAEDTSDFVAGGLAFQFSDIPEGIHIDLYDNIEFDVKMESGSFLEETMIRLEDTTGNLTPELSLKHFGKLAQSWSHFVVPLDTLCTRQWFHGPHISSVQRAVVTHLITVAKHTGTEPTPTNGAMSFDNVYLTKN